jgi:acyl dehydratase
MIDRKWIGTESEVRHIDVEAGQLRLFALATGQTDPVYTDEAAARAAGHPALPAAPTFPFSLMIMAPAARGGIEDMEINIGKVLHGEQSFDYRAPIHAGDRIAIQTRTADIYDKKGGALEFVVQDTSFTNQHGALCALARSILVVRN